MKNLLLDENSQKPKSHLLPNTLLNAAIYRTVREDLCNRLKLILKLKELNNDLSKHWRSYADIHKCSHDSRSQNFTCRRYTIGEYAYN